MGRTVHKTVKPFTDADARALLARKNLDPVGRAVKTPRGARYQVVTPSGSMTWVEVLATPSGKPKLGEADGKINPRPLSRARENPLSRESLDFHAEQIERMVREKMPSELLAQAERAEDTARWHRRGGNKRGEEWESTRAEILRHAAGMNGTYRRNPRPAGAWATYEYIRPGEAIVEVKSTAGEWLGGGLVKIRSTDRAALYEAAYTNASQRAHAHGLELERFSRFTKAR